MARIGRRAKQRRTKQFLFGTLVVVFAVSVLAVAYYYTRTAEAPIDKVTLCPEAGPKGHFVLLVDKTDPLTFTQRNAFGVMLEELVKRRIPEGYLLSVFALAEDFQETAKPIIERCNPGSGAGKSEYTHTLKILREEYEAGFVAPVMKEVDSLVTLHPQKSSPIFEMVQLVGVNAFRKQAVDGERRLIMVSDMLQNMPAFSMFQQQRSFTDFERLDYAQRVRADLPRVTVELHYLMHAPRLQTMRNVTFWEQFFEKAGARVVEVRRLEG